MPLDICLDLSRRLPHYFSDYYDSKHNHSIENLLSSSNLVFQTHNGPQKVLSAAVFLYFACLLPSIAFGVLNSQATNNQISMWKKISRTDAIFYLPMFSEIISLGK